TVVSGAIANTTFTQGGQSVDRTEAIAADAILLPSPFWAPYEALAQRLKTAAAGSQLAAWVPGATFPIQVGESTDETIQTASQVVHARRTAAKMVVPGVP